MTLSELETHLSEQFDVLCFVDIADVIKQHDAIFQLFSSLYRPEFTGNQKLILYSSQSLTQEIFDHIQRAAAKVDISNFFILICSPDNIQSLLDNANSKFGYDDTPMSWRRFHFESKPIETNNIHIFENICILPFTSLTVGPTGKASPCCNYSTVVGNANDESLKSIFAGNNMQALRDQLKKGEKPAECRICWEREKSGSVSLRQHGLAQLNSISDESYFETPQLCSLTISPNNTCNFKCRICDYGSSSLIASEELRYNTDVEKIIPIREYVAASKIYQEDDRNINQVFELVPHLSKLDIVGGEPFLLKSLNGLLQRIIDHGYAQNINVGIHTNCSTWRQDIIDSLKNFKSVEILLSIDDIGSRFEIQRGGVWEDIEDNIKKFVALNSRHNITVKAAPTVNIQNVLYLDEIQNFFKAHELETVWWYLAEPEFLSIDQLTETAKNLVYKKYHNHYHPEMVSIANRMKLSPGKENTMFLEHMNELDRRRKQSFSATHPEIYKAMGGK